SAGADQADVHLVVGALGVYRRNAEGRESGADRRRFLQERPPGVLRSRGHGSASRESEGVKDRKVSYTGVSVRAEKKPALIQFPPVTMKVEILKEKHMTAMTIEDAQTRLPELIENLQPGEEIIITRNEVPVARLIGEGKKDRKPRQL